MLVWSVIIASLFICVTGYADYYRNESDVTMKDEDLSFNCWKCYSTSENDSCFTVNETTDDGILSSAECGPYEQYCKVERVWYIIGVNNELHNFSINRTCSAQCKSYFHVMGDRTKIYSSASCCTTSLCNVGSYAHNIQPRYFLFCDVIFIFYLLHRFILDYG